MGTNTIQVSVGGKVLVFEDGTIMRECCCTTNPCGTCTTTVAYPIGSGGVTYVYTNVPCPSVKLTVTAPGVPPVWQATTGYSVGDYIQSSDGVYVYRCTVAGTSGGTEPTWGAATVFDNTVTWSRQTAGFSFNWCNEQWDLPSDNGETRTVCPDDGYSKSKQYRTFTIGQRRQTYRVRHTWNNAGAIGRRLRMVRTAWMENLITVPTTANYYARDVAGGGRLHNIRIRPEGHAYADSQQFFQTYALNQWLPGTVSVSTTTTFASALGILPYAYPRYNNYKIPDAFFSTQVIALGANLGNVTVKWEKGADWP